MAETPGVPTALNGSAEGGHGRNRAPRCGVGAVRARLRSGGGARDHHARGFRHAASRRDAADLLGRARQPRRDVVAGAADLCLGRRRHRRQCRLRDRPYARPRHGRPVRRQDRPHRGTLRLDRRAVCALRRLTVMFARFFNILRQLNGIVAGTLGMSWWRFLVCNAVGAALWVLIWMLGAFYISQHASILAKAAHHIGVAGALAAAAAIVAALFTLWHWRRAGGQTP